MDLHQLRSFAEVAATGHVTRAAERLHLSQPAVSGHIKTLEEELGVVLFDRTGSGVSLTRAGKLLLEDAERVLDAARGLHHRARALSGKLDARLRIGTIFDPGALRLGELLAVMREQYPLIDVDLQQHVSGVALGRLKNHDLDAAFTMGESADPALRALVLKPIRCCVVGPKAWSERASDWKSLAQLPWVATPPQGTTHRIIHQLLRDHGLAPASLIEADQEATIRSLVAAGVGMTLVREELAVAMRDANEAFVWDGATVDSTLCLVYLHEREEDPEIRVLVRAIRKVWKLTE